MHMEVSMNGRRLTNIEERFQEATPTTYFATLYNYYRYSEKVSLNCPLLYFFTLIFCDLYKISQLTQHTTIEI